MLPVEGTVKKQSFYCLRCAAELKSEYSVQQHVLNMHNEKPKHGANWAAGWQVEQMRERFLMGLAPRIIVFIRALQQEPYTVEDFLTDCGAPSL